MYWYLLYTKNSVRFSGKLVFEGEMWLLSSRCHSLEEKIHTKIMSTDECATKGQTISSWEQWSLDTSSMF